MITASELGLTTDQHTGLMSSIQFAHWRVTAYRWNLKFDSTLHSVNTNTGSDWDAINHDSTIYRVNSSRAEKLDAGTWVAVGTFVPLSNLVSNYSLISSGSTLIVFAANTSGISRCTWDGSAWSSWTQILTLATVRYIAATDENTLHYVSYDSTAKLWNFRVLKYSGSWTATASDIHWQYPVRSFAAIKLGTTDVLLFSAAAPGNLTADYIDGEAVKTTVPSAGVFALTYKKLTWSDHIVVDVIDEERSWKYRRAVQVSNLDGTLYLTCYTSTGTQLYPYRNYKLYTSKDGKHWSRGQFMKLASATTYGVKLLRLNHLIYALERNNVNVSKSTLFTNDAHTDTVLDITQEVRSNVQLSRRDMGMAQVRVSLSNSTGWMDTSILDGTSTVLLKVEGGYRVDDEDLYVPLGLFEVDSIERTQDLPNDTVELVGRDYMARLADKSQSEEFFQWEPQFGGGDEYNDYTGTDKGGLGNTAVMSGSWSTPSNTLVLLSKNKEGVALSYLISDQWNGVQEHSFTLVNASNNEYAGVIFRGQDKDNFWTFLYDQASDTLKIVQRTGGSDTTLWTSTSMSWASSPSTRRWLRVQFRYARVQCWTSDDGITWTSRASILLDGQEDVVYDAFGYPLSSVQKIFRGLVGVIGKGYSDEDTFDYTAPVYGAPTYDLPTYPVLALTGSLAPYTTNTVPTKIFAAAATSAQAAIATEITVGGTFLWTEISTGLSGNSVAASSDPFDYSVMYLLTTAGLYRSTPYNFSGWTLVADNLTMFGNATYVGQKILMSINRQGWIYVLSGVSMRAWSFDYGVTWHNNSGAGGTGGSSFNGDVIVSPYNDGSSAVGWLYANEYVGGGNHRVYKSTDWGQTWTQIASFASEYCGGRFNLPYKKSDGSANENNGTQEIYYIVGQASNRAYFHHSTNGGSSWPITQSWSAANQTMPCTSLNGTSIQTFTYDGGVTIRATQRQNGYVGIRIEDDGTLLINQDLVNVGGANAHCMCVNGFSYHRGAAMCWNQLGGAGYLYYTFDGGVTGMHSANLPSFFTGTKCLGYAEWPLIDQWTPPS